MKQKRKRGRLLLSFWEAGHYPVGVEDVTVYFRHVQVLTHAMADRAGLNS
jgi:hypothetical protein